MSNLKPIVIAVAGAAMLSACGGPAVRQSLQVQGVQRVSQSTEQSAASWYRLGKYHQERGQLSLALGAYAQSLALDAGQLDARNAVATIDAQQGRLADARDALRRLVDDYPGEAQPLNNLGYVYYLMGDYPAAIATLQRAVALEPNGRAYYNLVQAQTAARDGAPASALAATTPAPAPAPAVTPAPATPAAVADVVPSRLELVQLAPQVLELKLRASQSIAAVPAVPAAAPVVVAAPPLRIAAPVAATPVLAAAPASMSKAVSATPAAVVAAAPAPAPKAVSAAPAPAAAATPAPVVAATPALPKAVAAAPAPVAVTAAAAAPTPAPAAAPKPAVVAAIPAPAAKVSAAPAPAPAAVPATVPPRLEISNGNGVTGLAARYRSVLGKVGILASRLSNARPFRQQESVIEYRPGFAAQAASLQRALPGRTALQQSAALTRADVRLLLGKDAPAQLAQAEQLHDGARFAAVVAAAETAH
ncbi:MAG TPA: tetratricopeptide repeat protein [Burkholderiaceae bacterium]|nr:tetratricopeptide repeat protein [Burkholderiaceae bacterium]